MNRIYRVPILGYLVKVIVSVIKAPKRFEMLWDNQENMQKQLNAQAVVIEQQKKVIENCRNEIALQREINKDIFQQGFEQLLKNREQLEQLNMELSIHPTVWGDKTRLCISPLAAVSSCFFNTNSGVITVGDYTFSGSNVSLLAGSHDMYLTGLNRRDNEYKEGYDITIGEGVWLSSGCTVLGPCTIGDNAVIAAGAVVAPGTDIPANCVYAGVPARKIKDIAISEKTKKKQIVYAMQRENGVLFERGWSEKRQILCEECEIRGHWLLRDGARIITNKSVIRMLFHKEVVDVIKIKLKCGGQEKTIVLNRDNQIIDMQCKTDSEIKDVYIFYESEKRINDGEIFLSVIQDEEE